MRESSSQRKGSKPYYSRRHFKLGRTKHRTVFCKGNHAREGGWPQSKSACWSSSSRCNSQAQTQQEKEEIEHVRAWDWANNCSTLQALQHKTVLLGCHYLFFVVSRWVIWLNKSMFTSVLKIEERADSTHSYCKDTSNAFHSRFTVPGSHLEGLGCTQVIKSRLTKAEDYLHTSGD